MRGAFHLSLTVLVHYRSLKVLSLGGWSPQLPTNSPGFVVLRIPVGSLPGLSTGLSPSLAARSSALECRKSIVLLVLQPLCACRHRGLGSSRFARHYYGNLMLISFRRATEMFQFTHFPPLGYVFPQRSPDITLEGLPHSDSPGSSLACSSPGTFRRSPRPSSAFSAKASTLSSCLLVLTVAALTLDRRASGRRYLVGVLVSSFPLLRFACSRQNRSSPLQLFRCSAGPLTPEEWKAAQPTSSLAHTRSQFLLRSTWDGLPAGSATP